MSLRLASSTDAARVRRTGRTQGAFFVEADESLNSGGV
jgi:hypothetical protein